ncbi:MAG TPA: hypothetical protein VEH57_09570 [Thermoplasmata archaeon]|nr:hypothetical protein [Thermoplasmata archaeon]
MGWREAAHVSDVAFTELSLQAVYAFRQGNLAPPGPPRALVARARRRVVQSKALVSGFLGLIALGAAFVARVYGATGSTVGSVPVTPPVFDVGLVVALLGIDVAFLWWAGIQVLPTLLASGVLPVLEPLPIDPATFRRTAALLYLRLFDLPALTVIVTTPLFLGVALGFRVGLAVLPGVLIAVAFSLALSLVTGRFFVRRIQGSRGGGGRAVVRWAYLVLWLLPAFATFGFLTSAPDLFVALGRVVAAGTHAPSALLWTVFPFPFAALPAIAVGGPSALGLSGPGVSLLLGALLGYTLLAAWAAVWLFESVRTIGHVPAAEVRPVTTGGYSLRPTGPVRAVLLKDLRIASRTPGYAFLILVPILDAFALGFFTYIDDPGPHLALSLGLGAVTTAALLATFFGPAFFAIEVLAYAYGRTLPLPSRANVLAKTVLVGLIYLIAGSAVLGFVAARIFAPTLFAVFILSELPAVIAAAFLEFGLLFWRARARSLPITNLYTGAWAAILVSIPGLLVAGAPLVAYSFRGLPAMALVAVIALALTAPLALGRDRS